MDSNEHLGLIVSGIDEEQQNVDENPTNCRNSPFGMFGQAYAFKCLLTPLFQHHLWQVCYRSVLGAGLWSLCNPNQTNTHQVLRGFPKQHSSTTSSSFLASFQWSLSSTSTPLQFSTISRVILIPLSLGWPSTFSRSASLTPQLEATTYSYVRTALTPLPPSNSTTLVKGVLDIPGENKHEKLA